MINKYYLMENNEEETRLEIKTDPAAVRKQALWCGIKPGMRVLDAGCGPGITTTILHSMIQPGGTIVGIDYSEKRITYATHHYSKPGMDFHVHDLREPACGLGLFDLIWVRFVLEYNRKESRDIVRNLSKCLKEGGYLCLLDLDYNCLSHYELPVGINELLPALMARLDEKYNFDTFAGRKLYSYLYDLGFQDISVNLMGHHLIYGKAAQADIFNWFKKMEIGASIFKDFFKSYPGGGEAFFNDLRKFFLDPRRFTYTPLIICKGRL
jgi:SAM-dependent methyltransferase